MSPRAQRGAAFRLLPPSAWPLAAALVAAALAGCGIFQTSEQDLREEIVETALDQVGEDYEFGGADPDDGFDCSGLVHYAYAQSGITLPRSAAQQRKAGKHIRFADAQPGDLLFYAFGDRRAGDLHVVMFTGAGRGVHAPVRDGEVEEIDVGARHWRKHYVGATRVIRPR